MLFKRDNWHEGQTVELEVMHSYNISDKPNSLYVRAIIYDPVTKIRSYQKLVKIDFTNKDKVNI
jgi:hypothetical protein